jgi:predicted N-acyltransferase
LPADRLVSGSGRVVAGEARQVRLVGAIEGVTAADWDALVPDDNPFLEHAFLLALERSGSAGPRAGWAPAHLVVEESSRLAAALPLYLRGDSYGEYVFDWSWAGAARKLGVPYYPKLTSAVPFTPAGQGRLLGDIGEIGAVAQAVEQLRAEFGASSHHVLFPSEAEQGAFAGRGYVKRLGLQFHWHDAGFGSFDGFVAAFSSKRRKELLRERRQVREAGVEVRALAGEECGPADWEALRGFYRDTIARNGAIPYLTDAWWRDELPRLAGRVLAVFALRHGERVAGALNFRRGGAIYGRYWGCREDVRGLHFEVCYHQLVEWGLAHGVTRVEAGAQGEHKLQRGFLPVLTFSAHRIADPRLHAAVADFCAREAVGVRDAAAEYGRHSPFREGG